VRLPRLDLAAPDSEPREGNEVTASSRRRSILVVDDNDDAASSMAMLLRMMGHDASIAHDGESALRGIEADRPDIVLLDIGLPGMSGYEVAERLRKTPAGKALRLYALTGYGQEEDRRRSAAAGFDGHLVKPVMPGDLFALIESAPVRGLVA